MAGNPPINTSCCTVPYGVWPTMPYTLPTYVGQTPPPDRTDELLAAIAKLQGDVESLKADVKGIHVRRVERKPFMFEDN